jgi:hypothetical protein
MGSTPYVEKVTFDRKMFALARSAQPSKPVSGLGRRQMPHVVVLPNFTPILPVWFHGFRSFAFGYPKYAVFVV